MIHPPERTTTACRRLSMLDTALAPIIPLLEDDTVIEIMLNADGAIWVECVGKGVGRTELRLAPGCADRSIRLLASAMDTTIDARNPSLAGTLPGWGARFQASIPPIVEAPVITIRKPPKGVFRLADYVAAGILTPAAAACLTDAVRSRANILVGGSTGSGKTTLANALLDVVAEGNERVYLVEDNRELQCNAPNKVQVLTTADYPMRRAIVDALRQRPDRIIVGEVRDKAALDLLKAWNTGHPGGIATIHANDTRAMLERLCQLVEENNMPAPRAYIAEAIDVCVHLVRAPHHGAGRRLSGLVRVQGLDAHGDWRLLEAGVARAGEAFLHPV
jgi:P-type conjugative transfer ATPase TrbB